jgi:D-beta-D-heptose 7-phosphate kinase / D-beta-D-heptose 1-phosphate adenosyltransferase
MMTEIDVLERIGRPRLLVVGDLMLDRQCWGRAERVCPEAPVPVLAAEVEESRPGGAAAVAALAAALGAQVSVAGVIGCDAEGRALRRLLRDAGIDSERVLCDLKRPTTVKQRFLAQTAGGRPQQLLRVDHEGRQPLAAELEWRLMHELTAALGDCQAVLVSDYGKGLCSRRLLGRLLDEADEHEVPVLVDPALVRDYGRYRRAALVLPNRAEAALTSGLAVTSVEDALAAGRKLCDGNGGLPVLLKLDRDGLVLTGPGEPGRHFPAVKREALDPSGAGDMVLAVVGLCRAAGLDWPEAIPPATVAAGWEVEQVGVLPLSRDGLRGQLLRQASGRDKLVSVEALASVGAAYRQVGQRVVFTNGCFDLLHAGHVRCLEEAARQGDILVVGLNSDRSVRRLKGCGRPVVGQWDRAALLAALACVNHVVLFDDDTPHALLEALRPQVLVKGGTYQPEQVVGREVVERYGGKVVVVGRKPGLSTTHIVDAIRGMAFGEAS